MAGDTEDLESYLRVGKVVVLHLNPHQSPGPQFRTFIRGWHKSSHIMVDRPALESGSAPLTKGQPCVLRFVSDGFAGAFESSILSWEEHEQGNYCNLSWPQDLQIVPFRKHYRTKVEFPCKFSVEDETYEGIIRDLSIGGCGVFSHTALAEGTDVEMSFTLPDGLPLKKVRAIVREARPMGDDALLACEFYDRQEHVQSDVAFYLSSLIERERGGGRAEIGRQLLIIDENEDNAASLKRGFRDLGWDAVIVSSTIDGMHRLHATPPVALIVSQEQQDLTGLDIIRMVKSTSGFESLPVFLYGKDTGDLRARALEIGVAGYFPHPFDSAAICKAVLAGTPTPI